MLRQGGGSRYFIGVLIVLLGGVFLSLSGILLRHIESANGWQILVYRSFTYFITIGVFLAVRYRGQTNRRFRAIGRSGLLAGLVLSIGSVLYIMAMLNTTVANVVFILGASPLLAALAGWLLLGERVTRGSLIAMIATVGGIGLMFADGLVSGGMLGNVFALGLALMYVWYLLILRGNRHIDMLPATCLSGLFTGIIALVFVGDLSVSNHDLAIILVLGAVQFGLGFMCLTWGTRYIPAAEVALYSLSESILNPLWVWIGVGETPGPYTLAGSAVVLVSVVTYSIIAIRRERLIRRHSAPAPVNSPGA